MRYILGLFWALTISAQTVVLTDPSQFRHRTRLISFETTVTGEPLRAGQVVHGTDWASVGVHLRTPDYDLAPPFQVLSSPQDPVRSVISGKLSLWQWRRGFQLITFPGVNLPPQRRRLARSPDVHKRGFTREFGVWIINGSFNRGYVVGPYPTVGHVRFYDRHGQMITNITTGTTNTFVGLRHPAGIAAVVIEHSTFGPIIDDIHVGRVFRTDDWMLDPSDFREAIH